MRFVQVLDFGWLWAGVPLVESGSFSANPSSTFFQASSHWCNQNQGKAPRLPLTGDISLRIHALGFVVQCSRLDAMATSRPCGAVLFLLIPSVTYGGALARGLGGLPLVRYPGGKKREILKNASALPQASPLGS